MKLIDRYIGKTVIGTTLLVLLMLIAITIFITFIQQINDIGTGNYHFFGAFLYVLLALPNQVYIFFPMGMLVGVSLGLGLLANHNELTILRTSGVTLGKITWTVMKATLLLIVISTLLGEWAGPLAERFAERQKTILTSNGQALETAHGTWVRDGLNFLYIDAMPSLNRLEGINRYQFDTQRNLVIASHGQSGIYQHGQWVIQNIVESKISLKGIETKQYPTANWQLSLNPKLLRISAVDPSEMTLWQLYHYIIYLHGNHLNTSNYSLTFWQRLFQPLATLIMVWLAIPFVFGSLRKITIGLRMMMGISLGFGFYLLNQFFGPLSIVYQWPTFFAATIPILLFAFTAYILQRRAH